jgi:hypothetical protein
MRRYAARLLPWLTLIPSLLLAQEVDVPLRNWTVPPYTVSASSGGITTMTDVTAPRVFVGVAPCRIADTRGLGFTGQAGPPALNTGPRVFQIYGTVAGVPTQCGIPAGADAVSFQFTIVSPNTAGNLIAWPGGPAPTISVLNWSAGETALGNGTIVPLSDTGSLSVQINAAVGNATGHLVLDVNGYFGETLTDTSANFTLANNSPNMTAFFRNQNTTTGRGIVVWAEGNASTALEAEAFSASGTTFGVSGETLSIGNESAGVRGKAGVPPPYPTFDPG